MPEFRSSGSRRQAAARLAVVAGVAAFVLTAPSAQAQVNMGVEGGVAGRTGSPTLNPGLAWGAHFDVKPIPMLSIGAYYLGYNLSLDDAPSTVHKAAFQTFGGKLRFTLPVPGSDLRPYAFAGLGRVGVTYPVESVPVDLNVSSGVPSTLLPRDGHFLEVPIGLGLGYKTAKIVELSIDFAIRPSFAFGGDAFEGERPYDETKLGFTGMLGAAIDL